MRADTSLMMGYHASADLLDEDDDQEAAKQESEQEWAGLNEYSGGLWVT